MAMCDDGRVIKSLPNTSRLEEVLAAADAAVKDFFTGGNLESDPVDNMERLERAVKSCRGEP